MAIKIGFNGFDRMGRLGLRVGWSNHLFEFIHINEIAGNTECSAHLLHFDSVHGRWSVETAADDQRINCPLSETILEVDWSSCDIVIEAKGALDI